MTTDTDKIVARAWALVLPELSALAENWDEAHCEENPEFLPLAADIAAGRVTPDVLDEMQSCLDRDWCTGRLKTAFLTVMAAHGALEKFDPAATYLRKPRTQVLLGERWLV